VLDTCTCYILWPKFSHTLMQLVDVLHVHSLRLALQCHGLSRITVMEWWNGILEYNTEITFDLITMKT